MLCAISSTVFPVVMHSGRSGTKADMLPGPRSTITAYFFMVWLGLQSRWSQDTHQSHRRLQERQNQNGPPMNADKHFVFNLLDQIRPLREGSTPIRWFLE